MSRDHSDFGGREEGGSFPRISVGRRRLTGVRSPGRFRPERAEGAVDQIAVEGEGGEEEAEGEEVLARYVSSYQEAAQGQEAARGVESKEGQDDRGFGDAHRGEAPGGPGRED